jgi:superfamily II DNA or RNA helicase
MNHEHLKVEIYSHNFVCKVITPKGKWLCSTFAKDYIQYGFVRERGRYNRAALKVFAAATDDRVEFRFHINCLAKFREFLIYNGVEGNQISFKEIPLPVSDNIELPIKSSWTTRESQEAPIAYLENPNIKNKLLTLQTGSGKGYCSIKALSTIGKRTIVIVRPMFIDKLRKEFLVTCDIDKDDVLIVQGSKDLMALLELGKQNLIDEKIIIISNKTIQNWFKAYEKYRTDTLDLGYACYPHELYQILHAGVRLVDEVHMDIHLQCKIDLYTHVEESFSLSATLLSDDPFITKMQDMMYPRKDRFESGALDKYIDSYAVSYALSNPDLIRTTEYGASTYSHMAFEKSLLRNKSFTRNYFELIEEIIRNGFLKVTRPKKKLAVYAASIDMCTQLTNHFKKVFPNLDIRRYCENDPYENLLQPDIRFTTFMSASVGHDIPDLTTVINTVSIKSPQAIIQCSGRLRKLADGHPVSFFYFVCKDIKKHLQYMEYTEALFRKRMKSQKIIDTNFFL